MTSHGPGGAQGRPGIVEVALFGACPRCGARTLFGGWIDFAPRCRACGLDFARFNVGDGPAALLILVIGALVAGLAIWLQLVAEPPFWVHGLLWVPLATALVIAGLRATKGALLASEFRNKAGEARRGE